MTNEINKPVEQQDGPMPKTEQFEASVQAAPTQEIAKREPDAILGADQSALGEDGRKMLVGNAEPVVSDKAKAEPAPEESMLPDNSEEGLKRNLEISVARGFVRAKGFADHLYSDDTVLAEHKRYKEHMATKANEEFKMSLKQPVTYMHKPKDDAPVVAKRAEYATIQGAPVPQYEDKEKSDWPVPAVKELPKE